MRSTIGVELGSGIIHEINDELCSGIKLGIGLEIEFEIESSIGIEHWQGTLSKDWRRDRIGINLAGIMGVGDKSGDGVERSCSALEKQS